MAIALSLSENQPERHQSRYDPDEAGDDDVLRAVQLSLLEQEEHASEPDIPEDDALIWPTDFDDIQDAAPAEEFHPILDVAHVSPAIETTNIDRQSVV